MKSLLLIFNAKICLFELDLTIDEILEDVGHSLDESIERKFIFIFRHYFRIFLLADISLGEPTFKGSLDIDQTAEELIQVQSYSKVAKSDKTLNTLRGLGRGRYTYLRNFSTSRTIRLYSLLYWLSISAVGTKIICSYSSLDDKLAVSIL